MMAHLCAVCRIPRAVRRWPGVDLWGMAAAA
jgi:hypothetical protein